MRRAASHRSTAALLSSALLGLGCATGAVDLPLDAGLVDAGPADAGLRDAGFDGGTRDAGPRDAGLFDAGPSDAGPLEIGGSNASQFRPLEGDGGNVWWVQRGCQGFQMVQVGLRTRLLPAATYRLHLALTLVDDGGVAAYPLDQDVPFTEEDGGDARVATDLFMVVGDPTGILGREGELTVRVETPSGDLGANRRAPFEQGPTACTSFGGGEGGDGP